MGGSSYSDDFYRAKVTRKAIAGTPTFEHHAAISSGKVAAGVHAKLDPKGVIRESRDSDAHPESNAIAVFFDVTGSMHEVPVTLQKKLPQLMGLLLRKNYIPHPQILFGAVGDFIADTTPLQAGQFESGIEMDDDLTNFYLEGGGGGGNHESYLDAIYFAAKRTSCDCFEKRGKKGYLFIIGDERSYPSLEMAEVKSVLSDKAQTTDGKIQVGLEQADLTAAEVIRLASEKWEIFYLLPSGTTYYNDTSATNPTSWWKGLLNPQNVIKVPDPDAICETIGLTIGLMEGTVDGAGMKKDLADVGSHAKVVEATAEALDGLSKSTALAKTGSASGDLVPSGGGAGVDRL